jgi:hypothetical protein
MTTASRAGASSEFTAVGHDTNVEFVSAKGATLTPSGPAEPGDRILVRQDLSENGTLVGYSNIACTVTFNDNALCEGILAFTNKGDLHVSALLRAGAGPTGPPGVFDAVVDGGTFAYRGAHGDGHVVVLPNRDQQTTFTLV